MHETSAAAWLDNRNHPWQVMWWCNLTADERTTLLDSADGR
ncbi:hypothetical protein [Nocardia sp.]|nr:hypothetical protein [Nocardia sp.]